MTPDDWFDLLDERLGTPAVRPSDDEVEALLDLARVAAHTSERWTAPVSGFLVGVALADLEPGARARAVRSLADRLEQDDATSS
jgi:hypothetical protein